MTVHVNSVDLNSRNSIRSHVTNGTLLYVCKVRLLVALPTSSEWHILNSGYLALSAVGTERAFLTLFDLNDFTVLMVHELYFKFDTAYTKISPIFYAFPSDACLIGIQFLLESEGREMEKQIKGATPVKGRTFGLRRIFGQKAKSKVEIVVSMPQQTRKETGMAWDPERGYEVVGSIQDLSEEHRQFVLDQGCKRLTSPS
jgi:hypothetical protein